MYRHLLLRGLHPCRTELKPISSIRRLTTNHPVEEDDPSVASFVAIRLRQKSLLRVRGPESFLYLQSLLTNDMRRLLRPEEVPEGERSREMVDGQMGQGVIYAYLMSAVGKVLADVFVYRGRFNADGDYLLEVDSRLSRAIARLLLGYNTRRTIQVEQVHDVSLWSLIPLSTLAYRGPLYRSHRDEYLDPLEPDSRGHLEQIDSDDLKLLPDPRLGSAYLGYRFLTRLNGERLERIGPYLKDQTTSKRIRLVEGRVVDYNRLRYRLGVAEGYDDLWSGFYFPFELNGDIMNAVSLHKGLFTSEEKLIKNYSSTPIKRRIFPIEFLCSSEDLREHKPAPRTLLSAPGYPNIGDLRSRVGRFGIANLIVPISNNLIRFDRRTKMLPVLTHPDSGLRVRAKIPRWWPRDLDQIQLQPPDYPECLFNLHAAERVRIEPPSEEAWQRQIEVSS